jgi:hypothetical protein
VDGENTRSPGLHRRAIIDRTMTIEMRRIGNVLDSRPEGREAFLGIRPTLPKSQEEIILDFGGVDVLTPSFADEFIPSLIQLYPGKIQLCNTMNVSVRETLKFLSENWPEGAYRWVD